MQGLTFGGYVNFVEFQVITTSVTNYIECELAMVRHTR